MPKSPSNQMEVVTESNSNPQDEIMSTGNCKHVDKYKTLYEHIFITHFLNFSNRHKTV